MQRAIDMMTGEEVAVKFIERGRKWKPKHLLRCGLPESAEVTAGVTDSSCPSARLSVYAFARRCRHVWSIRRSVVHTW